MTSEICIMNRLAVVLAADSATTVTGIFDGKREERYFAGANKIFQLSNFQPVGLMIFDSGDIHNVPWEIIIKSFRAKLGQKAYPRLENYAEEFSRYISDNQDKFFPRQVQNAKIADAVENLFFSWIDGAIQDDQNDEDRIQLVKDRIAVKLEDARSFPQPEAVRSDLFKEIVEDRLPETTKIVKGMLENVSVPTRNLTNIARALLNTIFCCPDEYLEPTGFVFVGFGEDQIFPGMAEYHSYGLVCDKHLFWRKRHAEISDKTPALLSAFAETSVTNTFELGMSSDVFDEMTTSVRDQLHDFAREISTLTKGDIELVDDLESLVQATSDRIGDKVIEMARTKHGFPLVNVLRHLPVEEMAGLAETLITLQSLKVKIATPSERVGGPVDVAVITKHEGLVWIQRKHYFTPELNSRYALRQAANLLTWENDDGQRQENQKTSG